VFPRCGVTGTKGVSIHEGKKGQTVLDSETNKARSSTGSLGELGKERVCPPQSKFIDLLA
jgi:hypothetical protein